MTAPAKGSLKRKVERFSKLLSFDLAVPESHDLPGPIQQV
jgi:hypothetical protein